MPKGREPDSIVRRIVIECGRVYTYAFMTDDQGKLLDEDVFKQPFRLDRKDAIEEATELYGVAYDYLNEAINFPSASDGGESAESE
jgi:hypothetical protein